MGRVHAMTATDEGPSRHERTAAHGDQAEYEDTNGIRRERNPYARYPRDNADGPHCRTAHDEGVSKALHIVTSPRIVLIVS